MGEKVLKRLLAAGFALGLSLFMLSAKAGEAEVRKGLESIMTTPGAIQEINKLPYGEFYEAVLKNGQVLYVHSSGKYFFNGNLIDIAKKEDVTARRENERAKINIADLPLNQAIKQVRGNGKRMLVTFEDANCGYCKKLAREMKDLKDVTIYTFMIAILAPDSETKAHNIWCAADRAKAWNDWMIDNKDAPAAKCEDPVSKNMELANKYNIHGTPTIYLADGNRAGAGYMPLAQLEEALQRVDAKSKAKK